MGGFKFEGPEHRTIGDAILLRLPTGNIDGKDFSYQVGKNIELSYGQIVSLAGDFYGNCKYVGDAEQISDKWDTDPQASITRFLENANLLQLDKAGYLEDVMRIMEDQEKEIKQVLKDGKDIAQVRLTLSCKGCSGFHHRKTNRSEGIQSNRRKVQPGMDHGHQARLLASLAVQLGSLWRSKFHKACQS